MSDEGRKSLAVEAANAVAHGEAVLIFDPVLIGENIPGTAEHSQLTNIAQMINTIGERPLGLQAAQLIAVTKWLQLGELDGSSTLGSKASHANIVTKVRMETSGPRTQTIASVSAALKPDLFSALDAHHSIASFNEVFRTPLTYRQAPELMCLDLYRYFDFNVFSNMAHGVSMRWDVSDQGAIFWR